MSVRTYATRLARAERVVDARRPSGPDLPAVVLLSVDAAGVGHLESVVGPYRGCASCGWPPQAYEPFAGDEVALEAYYERHGWQPQRTILLQPHRGGGLRRADHET